jgi:signal transduction histidine kinase
VLTLLVTSVVRNIRPTLKPRVTIETSLDLNLPSSALGDPLRYRQVVQNLISNAVKFTESGSIDVHVSLVDEDATSFTIRTEVTDTGIGIQKVAVESLFSPFTQFDASATKRYKGTGLGLSICKSLAELSMLILEFSFPCLDASRVARYFNYSPYRTSLSCKLETFLLSSAYSRLSSGRGYRVSP